MTTHQHQPQTMVAHMLKGGDVITMPVFGTVEVFETAPGRLGWTIIRYFDENNTIHAVTVEDGQPFDLFN